MYASIRCYRIGAGSIDELMHRVDEEFTAKLKEESGFEAYQCLDCGDGTLASITIFRDEEGCDRSTELATEWVKESLGDFKLERTQMLQGEVLVSRAIADVLEPVHH